MTIEDDIQIVKDFFAAIGQGDKQGVVALCAEDIEWIIPGKGWPLPGTHRGHSGLEDLPEKASELEILYPTPPEYVAQGDRVLVVGVATGKIKATNRVFKDDWVFAITVRKQQADEDPGSVLIWIFFLLCAGAYGWRRQDVIIPNVSTRGKIGSPLYVLGGYDVQRKFTEFKTLQWIPKQVIVVNTTKYSEKFFLLETSGLLDN